ncbi:SHOCT domain-containing protein [Halalkalicoccus sp. NIPERK01]|uniref:SHOCT domain-containing protein n=1 Tax=Halalkalicoccus sp. NIPERK01 TaxID=3053469 RepID=UPI00256EC4C2|nr:SHOCT domain-containing protein [Halalkalicoccus sp. NIPERK01]MDL5361287.1 SHOCT domain-containing protein [Halalkalicoccus sp. NIPERK01]
MNETPADRLRENATAVASTVVTGVWLAALLTGQGWWLGALILGYVVVVPVVALLFGDEDDREEWWDDWVGDSDWEGWWDDIWSDGERDEPGGVESNRDALETLRYRYARGDLTDEQFERKLERLLETDTLESVEDRKRARERLHER